MVPAVLDDSLRGQGDQPGWEHLACTATRTKGDNSYRFMLLRRNQTEAGDAILSALVRSPSLPLPFSVPSPPLFLPLLEPIRRRKANGQLYAVG